MTNDLQQRTYHMDVKSTKFLKEYEQLLTSTFKNAVREAFSFELLHPPPVEEMEHLDVIIATIKDMRLTNPRDGGRGKELTVLFNARLEHNDARVDMFDLIDGSLFQTTADLINGAQQLRVHSPNEFILGRFEKGLSIAAVSAFSDLKNEIIGSGFFLMREGYVAPEDEEDEDD